MRAINTMDADIVSLEEIENSVKLLGETDRDDAVKQLVNALNTAAGSRRWAFAASPAAADLPALAEQDVIRTAFIYDPTVVAPSGRRRCSWARCRSTTPASRWPRRSSPRVSATTRRSP